MVLKRVEKGLNFAYKCVRTLYIPNDMSDIALLHRFNVKTDCR